MSQLLRDALVALGLVALGGAAAAVSKAWQQMRRDDLLLAAIDAGLPTVVQPSDARLVALLRLLREAATNPELVDLVERRAS